MAEDDYEAFFVGEVRVTQADRSSFLAYGDYLPGGIWISRGQVHLDSLVDSEAGVGTRGKLTVTRWWALSRGLKEAPRRGRWKQPERNPLSGSKELEETLPLPPGPAVPGGFTKR